MADKPAAIRHGEVAAGVVIAAAAAIEAADLEAVDSAAAALEAADGADRQLLTITHGLSDPAQFGDEDMRRTRLGFGKFHSGGLLKVGAIAIVVLACFSARAAAQQQGQKTFPSRMDAANALISALRSNDESAMLEILGADAKEIVSSGDPIQDSTRRADIVARYDQMHRMVKEPDGTITIYMGPENWPMPIPLMEKNGVWFFDTPAAKMEILFRRIGQNEISAIMVCEQLAAAQKEYYAEENHEYAQQIFSDEGQHNGLYWKISSGEKPSPIGPLVAAAEVYSHNQETATTPYRGYYFHVLTGQGKYAVGGAKSYLVEGKMTGGFGFVAYPAEYRSTGVVTFIVDKLGVVYQKDLGKDTVDIGKAMTIYAPDATWRRAKNPSEESATAKPATSSGKTATSSASK
jgi:hypothetical protein